MPRPSRAFLVALIAIGAVLFGGACTNAQPAPPAASTAAPAPATTAVAAASSAAPAAPAAVAVASTAAVATSELPTVTFLVDCDTVSLPIEVPPAAEYGIGLSGRLNLEGRGMLFSFPDGATTGFWMKGTHIDLDIAFIDAQMRVIAITTMIAETDQIHRPPSEYVAAVEAPAGWYDTHGVTTGTQATFGVDLRAATGR